ncbi:MAG: hypothetical protein OXU78_02675 [Deltaproteobacteria bacterium]|nr:hypothetical protein [Deltaproteobacteria bacterium]
MARPTPLSAALLALLWAAALPALAAHHEDEAKPLGPPPGGCTAPADPAIPADGASAAKADVLAAQKAVKAFVAGGEEFFTCLDKWEASRGGEISDEDRMAVIRHHNRMADAMHAAGDRFNQVVREYKAANKRGN